MVKPYDLIIFGASSFVGKLICRYLVNQYGTEQQLHWAIAGRSQQKLDLLKNELATETQQPLDSLTTIVADAESYSDMEQLCHQTKVICSSVGPYALYGEKLVKACAHTGTDYCDLTGEPQWIRKMLDKYEAVAQQTGARLVNCCGFDSIPSDIGVAYLQQAMEERYQQPASSITMRVKAAKGGISGGTAASMINITKELIANKKLRRQLVNPYLLCPEAVQSGIRQPNQKGASYDTESRRWSVPFIMAAINTRVVHRTNAITNFRYGKEFNYQEIMLVGRGNKGWLTATLTVATLSSFLIAATLRPGRWLLERFVLPKPGEGPTPKQQQQGFYDMRFTGVNKNNQQLTLTLTGDADPGYGSTCKIIAEAAVCLTKDFYKDEKKIGQEGGFWTPASIFNQDFIERLKNNAGLGFKISEQAHW